MINVPRHLAIFLLLGSNLKLMAGQVPGSSDLPDIPISSHDRVYTADQTSKIRSQYMNPRPIVWLG